MTPQNFLEFNFDLRDTPQIKIDRPPGFSDAFHASRTDES
jgi:hypothetical protein